MFIHGEFTNKQGQRVRVEILTGQDRTTELEIGTEEAGLWFTAEDPVVVESEVNDTFDVLLPHSCTVRLLSRQFRPEFFCTSCREAVVNVRLAGRLVFAGFIEPMALSQPYNDALDELELSCIDALSALQYSKYKDVGAAGVIYEELRLQATIRTFRDIAEGILTGIASGIDLSGGQPEFLWDMSKGMAEQDRAAGADVLSGIAVNDLLFLGDTEDDAWTQQDVLAELLRYLDLHIVQDGGTFRVFSWETLKADGSAQWHPLFGDVVPDVLNLSTGAPFQPFNRSPQIRYRFRPAPALRLTAAAVWQLQYLSNGPEGASEDYIKNSLVPEFYLGAEVAPAEGLTYGADAHLISLKPRVEATADGVTRRVDERMTTYTLGAHARLKRGEWMVAAKTFLASGLDHLAMLGGFGARSEDAATGRRDYTPFRHSTSWLNVTYGTRWKTALFLGYSKNLGTDDALIDREQVYGMGLDIDQLITCNVNISYNLPHWQLGVEYCPSTAFYGTTELATGRARHTRAVTNHRVLALLMYYF